MNHLKSMLSLSVVAAMLVGCASSVQLPSETQAREDAQIKAASSWQTAMPLPHGGSTAQLVNWWSAQGDAALVKIIEATQRESVSLAAAQTRVAQARAAQQRASDALRPNLGLGVQASRGVQAPNAPAATQVGAALQASWELDVWGGNQAASSAQQLRALGAQLGWHDARVAVAAEAASAYYGYRSCEAQLDLAQRDAASRAETARLTQLSATAGFTAPAMAQLASASGFDAQNTVLSTQAQCEAQLKSLVALSGIEEAQLRQDLQENKPIAERNTAQSAMFSVASIVTQVPAQLLAQRPDIAAAQLNVTAASQDIRSSDARRYPSLSLSGSIGQSHVSQMGVSSDGLTWSLGPIALNFPLTNQAANRADTEAAVAAYNEAVITLKAKVRLAVSEVETALTNLNATQARSVQAASAAQGYTASLAATQSRYKAGLASLVELEDARRTALMAQQSQIAVDRDRINAWIGLYRAAGGGWTSQSSSISTK